MRTVVDSRLGCGLTNLGRMPNVRRLPDAFKERGIMLVLKEMECGTGVSEACRNVGQSIGMNANTLRRLVAAHRRATAIPATGDTH